jgi:bacillithiol system protein YtxJ
MSFFKNMFIGSENQNDANHAIDWNNLTDLEELKTIITNSYEKPVAIFKHSTRCSVSRMALKQFENEFDSSDKVTAYFLDLITYREVSNAIAALFGVEHQSPQLVVIKNGKAVYDASHSDIDATVLKGLL